MLHEHINGYFDDFITLEQSDTILDIGANIGFYTIQFSKAVNGNGIVFAVEPAENNINMLKKNIETNKAKNVRVIDKAISFEADSVEFFLSIIVSQTRKMVNKKSSHHHLLSIFVRPLHYTLSWTP